MKRLNKSELLARHLNNLAPIIGIDASEIKIVFKQLRDLEHKGRKASENYCNLADFNIDAVLAEVRGRLKTLIKNSETLKNIHLNTDPRGYFLKISDEYVRKNKLVIETDWGGYGLLCPKIGAQDENT